MKKIQTALNESYALSQENAAGLVQLLSRFESSVMIHDGNRTINAKSLLGILSLGYLQSGQIEFCIDGSDEEAVCDALAEHFAKIE